MSTIEYRPVIEFFTRKDLNPTEVSKELDSVYKDGASSYRTVAKWLAQFKHPKRAFQDSSGTGRPFIITTDENIETVQWIVMRDRQVSVSVAYLTNCLFQQQQFMRSRVIIWP